MRLGAINAGFVVRGRKDRGTQKRKVTDRLTFARLDVGRLRIGPDAVTSMHRYAQNGPNRTEAGGVLLGRHLLDTDDIVVDKVTAPGVGDYRSRFRFFRARLPHQEMIDGLWRESGGTCTYLGEWHTHPEAVPRPSFLDRLEWWRKLLFDSFTAPLFFVIVGTEQTCVWEGDRFRCPMLLQQA